MNNCFIQEDEIREALNKIEFWKSHYKRKHGLLSDDEIEEVATFAIVRAWRNFDRDKGVAKFSSYADVYIKFALIDLLDKEMKKRRKETMLESVIDDDGRNEFIVDKAKNPLATVIEQEETEGLSQFVEGLKLLNCQNINFWISFYWDGVAQKTICEAYGLGPATVSNGIKKANALVADLYEKERRGEHFVIPPKFHGFAKMKKAPFKEVELDVNYYPVYNFSGYKRGGKHEPIIKLAA